MYVGLRRFHHFELEMMISCASNPTYRLQAEANKSLIIAYQENADVLREPSFSNVA
ncbi:MAG: hypothetical protein WBA39_14705 [Rivularia sp. (in: cyanobacteria)]